MTDRILPQPKTTLTPVELYQLYRQSLFHSSNDESWTTVFANEILRRGAIDSQVDGMRFAEATYNACYAVAEKTSGSTCLALKKGIDLSKIVAGVQG